MYLAKALELTTKSNEYDQMLRDCNHLSGRELELHKERMEALAIELKRVREEVNRITNMPKKEKSIYLNPFS